MASESAWQPLMVERFFLEEERKEERNYPYPLSRDTKNNVRTFLKYQGATFLKKVAPFFIQ